MIPHQLQQNASCFQAATLSQNFERRPSTSGSRKRTVAMQKAELIFPVMPMDETGLPARVPCGGRSLFSIEDGDEDLLAKRMKGCAIADQEDPCSYLHRLTLQEKYGLKDIIDMLTFYKISFDDTLIKELSSKEIENLFLFCRLLRNEGRLTKQEVDIAIRLSKTVGLDLFVAEKREVMQLCVDNLLKILACKEVKLLIETAIGLNHCNLLSSSNLDLILVYYSNELNTLKTVMDPPNVFYVLGRAGLLTQQSFEQIMSWPCASTSSMDIAHRDIPVEHTNELFIGIQGKCVPIEVCKKNALAHVLAMLTTASLLPDIKIENVLLNAENNIFALNKVVSNARFSYLATRLSTEQINAIMQCRYGKRIPVVVDILIALSRNERCELRDIDIGTLLLPSAPSNLPTDVVHQFFCATCNQQILRHLSVEQINKIISLKSLNAFPVIVDNLRYLERCESAFIASLLSCTEDHICNIAIITEWMIDTELSERAIYRGIMNDLLQSLVQDSERSKEIVQKGTIEFFFLLIN